MLSARLPGLLDGWRVGWLACSDWLIYCVLGGWLAGSLSTWQSGWLALRMSCWLAGWLAGWLVGATARVLLARWYADFDWLALSLAGLPAGLLAG